MPTPPSRYEYTAIFVAGVSYWPAMTRAKDHTIMQWFEGIDWPSGQVLGPCGQNRPVPSP